MSWTLRLAVLALAMMLGSPVGALADDLSDGRRLLEGMRKCIEGDNEAALKLLRPLAEQGEVDAQSYLGAMYYEGECFPQDYTEAVKWSRLAAEQGNAQAQNYLGVMYANGQGVPQDYLQAHVWFNLAGAGGDKNGAINRNIVAESMTPDQIVEAQHLAREWLAAHPNSMSRGQ